MIETKVQMGENTYPLYVGKDGIRQLDTILESHIKNRSILLLTEENVYHSYGEKVLEKLKNIQTKVAYCILPAGEQSKSMESYEKVITKLTEEKMGRSTILIALGGGMIGDLGGFIASTYMRGIGLIHIPTTLLAHIDSSIGGKTAINYGGFKNIVGTFYHPKAVLIDTTTLETLPHREYMAAFGEIIKYGMLADYDLLVDLNENYNQYTRRGVDLDAVILKCIRIKERIVLQDEKDFGLRQILNLGHTFAHGIESSTAFQQFFHGEAVALGLFLAVRLSFRLQLITEEYHGLIKNILQKYFPDILSRELDSEQILRYMVMDKKNTDNRPIFILPTGKEKVEIFHHISIEVVQETIMEVQNEFSCK